MRDYIIMTDSCCDLNQQEVDELGLTVLPLSFTIDGKTYLNTPDHAEMSPEEFFAKIAAGESSTTAAANVGQFDEAMRRALDAGKDILCIFNKCIYRHQAIQAWRNDINRNMEAGCILLCKDFQVWT